MFKHYLKVSLRNLLKYKVQSIISAIGLAVGISCFGIINSFLTEAVHIPFANYPDHDKIFKVYRVADGHEMERSKWNGSFQYNGIKIFESHSLPDVAEYFYYSYFEESRYGSEDYEMDFIDDRRQKSTYILNHRMVSRSFFSFNNCKLLYDNRVPQQPNEIVLSKSFAQKAFGKSNPVGSVATIVGIASAPSFTVVNVMEDLSMEQLKSDIYQCDVDKYCYLYIYGKLENGSDIKQLNKFLSQIKYEHDGETWQFQAELLKDRSLGKEDFIIVSILTLISSLILLSGLINFLKFIIQLFYNRQRELALRRSMGSDTRGLFSLLFCEVLWMLTVAFVLSLVTTELTFYCINDILDAESIPSLNFTLFMSRQFCIYLALLLLCMVIVAIPVKRLRRINLLSELHERLNRHLFRNLMIILQLTVGIFFLGITMGVSLLLRQENKALQLFDRQEMKDIVSVEANTVTMQIEMPAIIAEIKQLSQVKDVLILQHNLWQGILNSAYPYSRRDGTTVYVSVVHGSPNYFSFMNIDCTGEAFTDGSLYVSKEFAKALQEDSVSGNVNLGGTNYRIAGQYDKLIGERKVTLSGRGETVGSAFIPLTTGGKYVVVRGKDGVTGNSLKKAISGICRRHVPDTLPLSIETMDKSRSETNNETLLKILNTIGIVLAFISLLLVITSIYSSISMDTMRRRKEMAIRKINGGTPRDIARLFARPYLIFLIVSYLFALPAIYIIVNKTIDRSGSEPMGIIHFVLLFFAVALMVASTLYYRIARIMHINPAEIVKRQ